MYSMHDPHGFCKFLACKLLLSLFDDYLNDMLCVHTHCWLPHCQVTKINLQPATLFLCHEVQSRPFFHQPTIIDTKKNTFSFMLCILCLYVLNIGIPRCCIFLCFCELRFYNVGYFIFCVLGHYIYGLVCCVCFTSLYFLYQSKQWFDYYIDIGLMFRITVGFLIVKSQKQIYNHITRTISCRSDDNPIEQA